MTTRLTALEKVEFTNYARRYLLDAAGLLALLFARELRVDRLADLIAKDVLPNETRDKTVTFRVTGDVHARLKSFALERCSSLSLACSTLIRAEMRERWLETSMATRFESPST